MPTLRGQLDAQGQAFVSVALYPSGPRRQAIQMAGQPLPAPAIFNGLIDTGAAVTILSHCFFGYDGTARDFLLTF